MKKSKIILVVLTVIVMTFLTGCKSSSNEKTVWRFGHEEVNGSVMDEYALEFKRIIEEKTDGEIEVDIFRTGEIGGAIDYMEFLKGGLLDFAMINPGSSGTTIPENNVFYLHYILPQNEEAIKEILHTSEAMELLNEVNEKNGVKVLDWIMEGYQIWTTNNEVRKPEDFKGVSIRTLSSPITIDCYKAYGANPTPMSYTEVYSGLQLGQIDAQVNPIFAIEEMAFYEVQDYLINAKQDVFIAAATANPDFYNSLDPKLKNLIDETVEELNDYIFEIQKNLAEERIAKIESVSDINIIELNDEEIEKFKEKSIAVKEDFRKNTSDEGREILRLLEIESEKVEN